MQEGRPASTNDVIPTTFACILALAHASYHVADALTTPSAKVSRSQFFTSSLVLVSLRTTSPRTHRHALTCCALLACTQATRFNWQQQDKFFLFFSFFPLIRTC